MRLLSWTPVVLLVPLLSATSLASVSPADAAVLCQGEEATIVGVGDQTVVGTEGDDVIVAAGTISAGAGDDTICTSGDYVNAGAGDDSVTTEGPPVDRFVELGDGADRYVGSAGRDVVGFFFAEAWMEGYYDSGDDVIETGAGDDTVSVGSLGSPPQADRADLGPGDDTLNVLGGGLSAAAVVDGSSGRDQLYAVTRTAGPAVLDLPRTSLTFGRAPYVPDWLSFEAFAVEPDGASSVRVVGSSGPDDVAVSESRRLVATMGGSDDVLRVLDGRGISGRAVGGPGRDRLEIAVPQAVVDLGRGYAANRAVPHQRLRLASFADVTSGTRSVVIGDRGPNRLDVACGRVLAGGGDDVVRQTKGFRYQRTGPLSDQPTLCKDFTVRGGAGNDRIRGSRGRDDLDGGAGRDRVDGLAGRDRCVAERRVRCER